MASTENDILSRISMAWGAFWKLTKIWKAEHLSLKLKLEIYSTAVLSILLYGCESWITNDGL